MAMLGFVPWSATATLDLTDHVGPGRTSQVLWLRPTCAPSAGSPRVELPAGLVYVTKRRLICPVRPDDRSDWDGEYSDGGRRDPTVAARLCGPATREVPHEVQTTARCRVATGAVPRCGRGSRCRATSRICGRTAGSRWPTSLPARGCPRWYGSAALDDPALPSDVTLDVPVRVGGGGRPGQEAALTDSTARSSPAGTSVRRRAQRQDGRREQVLAEAPCRYWSPRRYLDEQLAIDVVATGTSPWGMSKGNPGPASRHGPLAPAPGDRRGRGRVVLPGGGSRSPGTVAERADALRAA